MVIESESAGMTAGTEIGQRGFAHSALIYHSQREYLDFVVRFVLDGLAMDEAVLVAVPGDKLALLRDALQRGGGGLPAELQMADITEVARNPSRLMAMEGSFAGDHSDRTSADCQPARLARPHRG